MMSVTQYQQRQQSYMTIPGQQDCVNFTKSALGYRGCTKAFCKDRHVDYHRHKKFCFQYEAKGHCARECPYRHCKTRRLTCKYFLAGTCKNGSGCMYSHGGHNHLKGYNAMAPIGNAEYCSDARELTSGDHQVPMSTFKEATAEKESAERLLAEARAKVVAYQQARKAASPPATLAEAELRARALASMTPKVLSPSSSPKAEPASVRAATPPRAEPVEDPLPTTSRKRGREEDSDSGEAANKKAKLPEMPAGPEKPAGPENWEYAAVVVIPEITYRWDEDQADYELSENEA